MSCNNLEWFLNADVGISSSRFCPKSTYTRLVFVAGCRTPAGNVEMELDESTRLLSARKRPRATGTSLRKFSDNSRWMRESSRPVKAATSTVEILLKDTDSFWTFF